ncbi:MAG: hypothetical protein H7227_03665 [Actinobacteria bacterium]|nr:hypothetical protein [Actinomycetota bacterium]
MSLKRLTFNNFGYVCVALGIVVGIASYVKIGAGMIAIGVGIVSYSNPGTTRIQRYLPLALALSLLVMAIALPSRR